LIDSPPTGKKDFRPPAEIEQITPRKKYGLGVVPWSTLARGVLNGKYAPDVTPYANRPTHRRRR
jgi:aryl-alcohol dehydrogenase-like predicted oxidoreductase